MKPDSDAPDWMALMLATEPLEDVAVATKPSTPAAPVAEMALAIRPPTG